MATTRFCSECGERLKVKRLSSPLFRSFCSRCSPRFNRGRLMLVVALAFSTVIGFAIGRFTSSGEPFYYIGTPIESSANGVPPSKSDDRTPSSRTSDAGTQREQLIISPSVADGACGARTRSGKPCQRKVKGDGFCWQHRAKLDAKKSGPTN